MSGVGSDVRTATARILAFLAAASCAAACGGAPTRGPAPISELEAACLTASGAQHPMIVEWPAADRAMLEVRAKMGTVVVRARGCHIELLDQCRAPDAYAYFPTSSKRQSESVRSKAELYAKLPVGAAKLEAKLSAGGELRVALDVVGTWAISRARLTKLELVGACKGATHVVTAITVGAFDSGGHLWPRCFGWRVGRRAGWR